MVCCDGTTAAVANLIPFGTQDDGADLVETAFFMQGLLTVQSYFKNGNAAEKAMVCQHRDFVGKCGVDLVSTERTAKNYFWHWSPNYGWAMNMPISGWDEALIVYVLAASSPRILSRKLCMIVVGLKTAV